MAKERRAKAPVEDIITENRALFGNILGSIAVIFLGWISVNVMFLMTSSKVQERELINMNKYFTVILEIQQRKLNAHVTNSDIHSYRAHVQTKGE